MSTMDTGSQKWGTPRYRSVNSSSVVDESLFGSRNGLSVSNKSRRIVKAPVPPSAVVISAYELLRIKNEAVMKSESELAAEREQAMLEREMKEKKSKERIARMKELEKKAIQLAKKSDAEIIEQARKQTLRDMADKQMDMNSDVVKMLSSMAQRAAAFTIRDQQLEEKHRLEQAQRAIDQRGDVIVEIDRVKEIQQREIDEQMKRTKRIEDRKVINEQIAERERSRLMDIEARELENQAMRDLMKKYEEDDKRAMERRQHEIERSKGEVLKANDAAIARKQQAKWQERKEIEDILIYQAAKDAELAKREEEERMVEKLKKERQAKLLAEQERVQNNAGKLDELRARRAAEEKERQERTKEKAEMLKKKKEMSELLASRAQQAADKQTRVQREKDAEIESLSYALKYSAEMDARERREREEKQKKKMQFRESLQIQIEEIERLRNLQRENNLTDDENSRIARELLREEEKLKVTRDHMVKELVSQGVNPKYLSEMRSVDIGKLLRR